MFEKLSALLFLLLLIGLVAFLTYVSIPPESKQVVLIIIGGLMTSAATALPKLFGVKDTEKDELKSRVRGLELSHKVLEAEHDTLKSMYDTLTKTLVEHHVIATEMKRNEA